MVDVQNPDPQNQALSSGLGLQPFDTSKILENIKGEREKVTGAEKEYATMKGQADIDAARMEQQQAAAHAGQMRNLYEQQRKEVMAPPPERKIDHDTATGFLSLAAMLPVAGAILGGKGQLSGINAMQAMTGMVEGYKKGNDERIAFETKKYEDDMKKFELHQKQVSEAFRIAIEEAKVNQTAAAANLKLKLAELNAPILQKAVDVQGITKLAEFNEKLQFESLKEAHAQNMKIAGMKRVIGRDPNDPNKYIYYDGNGTPVINPQNGMPIQAPPPGGGKGSADKAAQERNQRVITATSLITGAVEPLVQLKGGTTTGILPNMTTKDGMINFLRNKTGRKLTADESDFMNTLFAGIGRALASVETGGVATGLTQLANKIENAAYINAGASDMQAAGKLAELRDTVHEAINAGISSGQYNENQTKTLQGLLTRIDAAIPFSRMDVAAALATRIKGGDTVGSRSQALVKPPSLQEYIEKNKAANPGYSDQELTDLYNKKYGKK